MKATLIEDAEDLYRAIRSNGTEFTITNGQVKFSSSAFNDRARKPSVDRSAVRTDPRDARKTATDGVTVVRVAQVRSIRTVRIDPTKNTENNTYQVDAIHRPLPDDNDPTENPAHCQIECCPSIASDNHFKKLKEALALLANKHGFIVAPTPTDS